MSREAGIALAHTPLAQGVSDKPWRRMMSSGGHALARTILLWCTILNYGILLVWFLVFLLGHEWMYQWHGRWFQLSHEQFDALHYAGLAIYKVGILLFNLVPYVALRIVGLNWRGSTLLH